MLLYILPNQLFEIKHIPKGISEIILWEHPSFFTKYNFNKKKLILHRASMQCYYNELMKSLKNVECRYVNFNEKHKKIDNAYYFDPINDIEDFPKNKYMMESPNFFLTKDDYENIYNNKKSKSISFTRYFYPRCKSIVQFLVNTDSKDSSNRKPYSKTLHFNKLPKLNDEDIILRKAIKYVNIHFHTNVGNLENFNYPISRHQAKKFLNHFIKRNLFHFGNFQDAFNTDHDNMYHSILSSSLNIGLLNPTDIVSALRRVDRKVIPMNSLEGYFRQLCWREFQRYCYIYYKTLTTKSYFKLKKRMGKEWYSGTTNILPVDMCIKKAFDTGYLHHIERLMIMGNAMLLNGIQPNDGHRWFMEFAIDSYEWVMLQNVYDMVFFCGGGLTSYKPYITSSNYILKMSNYSNDKNDWVNNWNSKYESFLETNLDKLYKYRYHFPTLRKK